MTDKRKDCQMRHENGNCTVAGGFCTAVNDQICEALHNAFYCGYRSALRQQDHFREVTKTLEPLTNAQKIRSMSDEELAWELMLWRCEAVAKHHGIESEYPDTQKTILKWLQQPAEEAGHER